MGVTKFRSLKRKPLPVPEIVTRIWADGLYEPNEFSEVRFSLRTKKKGTLIYLHRGNQQWSLNAATGFWPKNFQAARKYVHQIAASHGYEPFTEIVKERTKRPNGRDAALLKSGGCRETWLSSDVPSIFAEACMRCQHPGGYCMQDGFCHYGDCDMEMDYTDMEDLD